MAFSVDTVFVWVNDLQRAVDWYKSFGIEAGPAYGAWQSMQVDGVVRFALHEGHRPPGASTGAIAFLVPDLDAEITRLDTAGIEPTDPEVTDTGEARFTTYRDPDGYDVQLLERRG